MERVFEGKKVSKGIGEGRIFVFRRNEELIRRRTVYDTSLETRRFSDAVEKSMNDLLAVLDEARKVLGNTGEGIFSSHLMILKDPLFLDPVREMIENESVNCEFAIASVTDRMTGMFSSMKDEYMKARYSDIKDVAERVILNLSGKEKYDLKEDGPFVMVSDTVVPGDLMRLKDLGLAAIVARKGSVYSHTAILARTMGIPAVTGVDFSDDIDGLYAIVNGNVGTLIVDPGESTKTRYGREKEDLLSKEEKLLLLKGLPNITLDGKEIEIFSNANSLSDISNALNSDAGGIGLLRSEFLYLEKNDYPSEEELFINYRKAAEMMGSKPVIIRTLDIGADKNTSYFGLSGEDNPALGLRGIRFSLQHPETLRTQLRAIYRASNYGCISILYPMITSDFEIEEIKKLENSVKKELKDAGSPYSDDVKRGFMIETPAAAIMSDVFAADCDFFSIGTNDLTQYMMACDRNNDSVALWGDPKSPAVLRAIENVVKSAKKNNVKVSICGEAAEDISLTKSFIEMGVDSLSVGPSMILPLRQHIRGLNLS